MQEKAGNEPGGEEARAAAARQERLAILAEDPGPHLHIGARLRNYLLTGLVIVGPVTITLYTAWWFINVVDAWVKP